MRKAYCKGARDSCGMTLVELMIAVMILVPVLTVVLQGFVRCMEMNTIARETSAVIFAERSKIGIMEKVPFNDIYTAFNGQTFTISGLSGQGTVTVNNDDPALLLVSINYVWTGHLGRVRSIGFSTYIYNRS